MEHLPQINALINTCVALALLLALVAIRRGQRVLHQKLMLTALGLSALFLSSYLVYHFNHGATRFQGTGWTRPVYFTLLISHTVLATVSLPLIVLTVWRAFRGDFQRHRVLAKWTWPMWFYVAATGPLVYLMLYRWFPVSSETLFEKARAAHQRDDTASALKLYTEAESLGHHPAACFRAALHARQTATSALAPLKILHAQQPQEALCLTLYARELVYEQQAEQAIPLLVEAAKLRPQDAFVQASLAFGYFVKFRYQEAAELFERALQLEPKNGVHAYNAAYAHFLYQNYPKAEPLYALSLRLGLSADLEKRSLAELATIRGELWVCPMHMHVVGEEGGTCSICEMPLRRVAKSSADAGEAKLERL